MTARAKYHLEGMGVVGSMLATYLHSNGVKFTWNDIDTKVNGWRAGTGCVLPTGENRDHENLNSWFELLDDSTFFAEHMGQYMDRHRWVYTTKHPPHHGKRKGVEAVKQLGPLVISNAHTINLNSQAMVEGTRQLFSDAETDGPVRGQRVIVTHGTATAVRYTWGWSGIVKAQIAPEVKKVLRGEGATFYLRKGIQIAYFYPIPFTSLHYAGTDIISQRNPKSLEIIPKYERWEREVKERTDGLVTAKKLKPGSLREGWRPIPEDPEKFITIERKRLYCRPMAGDGVRHFPELAERVMEKVT